MCVKIMGKLDVSEDNGFFNNQKSPEDLHLVPFVWVFGPWFIVTRKPRICLVEIMMLMH